MSQTYTIADLKRIISDLPDDTLIFTNYDKYNTGVYNHEYVDYSTEKKPSIKILRLIHTMSNCREKGIPDG